MQPVVLAAARYSSGMTGAMIEDSHSVNLAIIGCLCRFIQPARTFISSYNRVVHENTCLLTREARFAQDPPGELKV